MGRRVETGRLVRREERPTTDLDGDLVFLDADGGEYQVLRGTARWIWELLERPRTLEEICATVEAEYEVPPETCREQLVPFLEELVELELVEVRAE